MDCSGNGSGYVQSFLYQNLNKLKTNGIKILDAQGELASGLEGKGRMEEPRKLQKQLMRTIQN